MSILCIGHRGAKGYEPENTFASFHKAIELGVSWIELDVWNVEGVPVVIHDHRLERLTNGVGYVPALTLSYLRSLDAGNGQQVPLLSEVLDAFAEKVSINIELKGAGTARTVVPLLRDFVGSGRLRIETLLVSSFNQVELREAKILMPELRIGVLLVGIPLSLAQVGTDLNAYSVHQSIEFVTHEFVEDAHTRGLKVYVFTVNHAEDIRRMVEMGVDGIFTDYPDRATAAARNTYTT